MLYASTILVDVLAVGLFSCFSHHRCREPISIYWGSVASSHYAKNFKVNECIQYTANRFFLSVFYVQCMNDRAPVRHATGLFTCLKFSTLDWSYGSSLNEHLVISAVPLYILNSNHSVYGLKERPYSLCC
jgi:hypothetical protein